MHKCSVCVPMEDKLLIINIRVQGGYSSISAEREQDVISSKARNLWIIKVKDSVTITIQHHRYS